MSNNRRAYTGDCKQIDSGAEWLAEVPVKQVKEAVNRIKAEAEMGDVMKIKSIAEELKSESDTVAPFCEELIRLTDDFDFDGIQKIVLELDNYLNFAQNSVQMHIQLVKPCK